MNMENKADQLIAAITAGLIAGGKDEWEAPEFEQARNLTEQWGCVWEFESWRRTRETIQNHGRLGGINLRTMPRG